MKQLPNESTITSSNEDKIVLTNYRIQMTDKVWGKAYSISIFLEDISSIVIRYQSNFVFLSIGILFLIGGAFAPGYGEFKIIAFILGGIFIGLWWFSRKHIITISSKGGEALNFLVERIGDDVINNFVHKVSQAKLERVNSLSKI